MIDNASTDGTAAYLQSMTGKLRYRINPENVGFAGGVNQGPKMARGTRLLLLNNDTIVTRNWLGNVHRCLDSDDTIGLVGPMTNYISGDQLMPAAYSTLEEMHGFAGQFNRTNPSLWKRTARITGFCLLFRRKLFNRLRYFDEGFQIGNCEDDDFCLRVRLLGHELVIAGDVFIHHVGSVSMKALGSEMGEVYGRNLDFYAAKWGSTDQAMAEVERVSRIKGRRSMIDFYPAEVFAQGNRGIYWLHECERSLIEGAEGLAAPPIRLSHVELRGLAPGAPVHVSQLPVYGGEPAEQQPVDGYPERTLLRTGDGRFYCYEQGQLRRQLSERAMAVWGFNEQSALTVEEPVWASFPIGLPIIAPISIKADNI